MKNTKRMSSKDALMDAGFEVLSRNPGANLADIANAAGVSRATLHRYFPSRDAFIAELAQQAVKEIDQACEHACTDLHSAADMLKSIFCALVPLGDRYGFLSYEALSAESSLHQEFSRQDKETEELVAAAKKEGVFDAAVPDSWIAQAYDHMLYAAWNTIRTDQATIHQATDLAWRTFTSGLERRP